jgi:DNA-binding SARP family transcriptional activator
VLQYGILGPLEVLRDGTPVRLGGPRQRATLALLLLHANRVVSIDHLAEELYARRPPVTAVTQVQRQVSDLRKLLGEDAIATRPPGYVLRVTDEQFDLARFEQLTSSGDLGALRDALALWRGRALADLEYEEFAQAPIARLEELRLAALEERLRLELEDRPAIHVAVELETLVAEHPLHERLRALQMLALHRAGRDAEALSAYRDAHRTLMREVGLEPSAELRQLERAIRDARPATAPEPRPAVLAAAVAGRVEVLAALACSLDAVDVVLVRVVEDEDDVPAAAKELRAGEARTAAFASRDPAADLARLASANNAALVLVDEPGLTSLFERSPATVGVVAGGVPDVARGVSVLFGGGEHEWAALELAAHFNGGAITLVGRRDSSRLLADASLALQRVADVRVTPLLTDDVPAAVRSAGLVVAGVSQRWRTDGIGTTRQSLVERGVPTLLVHRGPRPSAIAPREVRTRFTWTVASP